ncbi:hypothetical protein D9756_005890 [Leucocoprinus leucothites]|uniref:PEHE domain-containing protein n=1 Tax=Leucocoprinus leucothites TaxID=201217 RepID=A0A8H5FWX8_9AGAR|nr:hypothetical protein D9756_005890 [Leucoagaricus leucothites]
MDPSGSTALSSNGRQKRVLPSRSRRGGPGVGTCETDLLILEHQKRRFETETLLPSTTSFLLTTDSKQFSTSNIESNVVTVSSERYFDRPDVLEGFRKGHIIQTPSYSKGAPDVGRFRPRGVEDTQIDTSDAAYERRHRKYETFEKRQRLREKEKLKHEQYKLKERIEQLRVMDASAFLALPASDFSPAPGVQEGDIDAGGISTLPGAQVNSTAAYSEGERRRKEMLDIALALEARFRVLLPPDRGRKPQPRSAAREDMAATHAISRRAVSDVEVSEREEEVVPTDGYNQRHDKIKIKLKLAGKDSTSGSPTPTSASRISKRSARTSLPPTQKPKRRQSRPTPSRSMTPVASPQHLIEPEAPASLASERTTSPFIDIEELADQAKELELESEEEANPPASNHEGSALAPEERPDTGVVETPQAPTPNVQPPTPPQKRTPLPDTRPAPVSEFDLARLENEVAERVAEPSQSHLPEKEGSPMHDDTETLSEPAPPPHFPSSPPIATLHTVSSLLQPTNAESPPRRRRGRPPKHPKQTSGLLELANAVQSLSANPPPRKRKKMNYHSPLANSRAPSQPLLQPVESDQESVPAASSKSGFLHTRVEQRLPSSGVNEVGDPLVRQSLSPPLGPSSVPRDVSTATSVPPSVSASIPPPEQISSISADLNLFGYRRAPPRRGAVIAEYQSETGELRWTDSLLLVAAIRGSQRQTQRHQTAFGVKVPDQIADPYDFWLPDEYLPEEELQKYNTYSS